jgi:hypothetical protein
MGFDYCLTCLCWHEDGVHLPEWWVWRECQHRDPNEKPFRAATFSDAVKIWAEDCGYEGNALVQQVGEGSVDLVRVFSETIFTVKWIRGL